ncbi:unnamed protein product, partial [Meganyctiphanes norvegica]
MTRKTYEMRYSRAISLEISSEQVEQAKYHLILPETTVHDENTDEISTRIKVRCQNFIIKMKDLLGRAVNKTKYKIQDKLYPVIQFLPVILSLVSLVLTLTDVATDGA